MINISKANQTLLDITKRYQNISCGDVVVPVPYFINTAEQEYKKAMKETGLENETITKVIQYIKDGKTALGSGGGKGTPEQITLDVERLFNYLATQGFKPKTAPVIREWMVEMHIGLDCSGYIYNIFAEVEKEQNVEILKNLAWVNPDKMKPSHAGVFIFNSPNFPEVTNYAQLKPLDLFIRKDLTHIGIIAEVSGKLCLADCAMTSGISFSEVEYLNGELVFKGNDSWTRHFKNGEIVIKRVR